MTNTTHYGLNIAEGTDNYNHLTVDNPNYQKIDTQMYTNAQAGVPLVTMSLQENTIAITRPSGYEGANMFRFVSSVNYNQSYTWTVDGTSVTPSMPNGGALPSQAFIIGSMVLCVLNGTALTVYTVPTVDMDSIKTQVMQAIYPVGSIIINENPTNPATTFGFGTWERIQGQFIFGADATHALNTTGGVENTTLTQDNMPSHSHGYTYTDTPSPSYITTSYQEGGNNYFVVGSTGATGTTNPSGNGTSFTNMPPYIAKYIWRRTA